MTPQQNGVDTSVPSMSDDPDMSKNENDGTIAITILVVILVLLLFGGYYLWTNYNKFGNEDTRYRKIDITHVYLLLPNIASY